MYVRKSATILGIVASLILLAPAAPAEEGAPGLCASPTDDCVHEFGAVCREDGESKPDRRPK